MKVGMSCVPNLADARIYSSCPENLETFSRSTNARNESPGTAKSCLLCRHPKSSSCGPELPIAARYMIRKFTEQVL